MATNNYKCPACHGVLEFDIKTQKLKCPYCGSEYEISDFEDDVTPAEAAEKEAAEAEEEKPKQEAEKSEGGNSLGIDTNAGGQWAEGEADHLHVYTCNSCGGEIVGDDNLAAARCPYCDSVLVRKEAIAGSLRPDYVIPFKLEKQQAKEAFAKHLLGKKLVSTEFVNENKIDEIKGVYVPFWLFDVDADADLNFECSNTASHRSGDYIITSTDIYDFATGGSVGFNNIPVDGSSKMADDMMESLEPFDFSEAVPFQTAYLAGYMADKYDVDIDASMPNVNRRIVGSVTAEFRKEVPSYGSVNIKNDSVKIRDSKAKYALYPIWVLSIRWQSKVYTYMMNGQTGKFVGDALPEDKRKAKMMRWIPTGILAGAGLVLGLIAGLVL